MIGSSSLNMRYVFIKVIYSESGKHILQLGSEIFTFNMFCFRPNLHRIKNNLDMTGYQVKLNYTGIFQDAYRE